ncbi:MAG: class I SAM-dependent methyltransferase [Deltaproteobacteria bacterium]|nr:class I SAM-dependent methyltransferase [Deltaproteobacteria bacterium]
MRAGPHSVRQHLRVDIDAYNEAIRRFIPGYEPMLSAAASAVAAIGPDLVLDLGAGTGALSAALLAHDEIRAVELLDVDPEMLEKARSRLAQFKDRAQFRLRSFDEPFPSCDAMAASLSLHHIPLMDAKRALYGRAFEALRSGGVFVNADCTMPADPEQRDEMYGLWVDHMATHGIEEAEARRHFEDWSAEDTYMPLEHELAALTGAGFEAECVWREGPMSVMVGTKVA